MKVTYITIGIATLFLGFFMYQQAILKEQILTDTLVHTQQYYAMKEAHFGEITKQSKIGFEQLKQEGCVEIQISFSGESCHVQDDCYADLAPRNIRTSPQCISYGVMHVETPEQVKGIYMTSHAVGSKSFRDRLFTLLKETELNTVVIDIKEVDGYVATRLGNTEDFPFQEERMSTLRDFITKLHDEGVYVIGRIVLFKDKAWAEKYPEHAVKRADQTSQVWTDYGGKKYIDPGAEPFWEYLVRLSGRVYQYGFDEIQADYIRFPSDGDMANTYYPYSQENLDALGKMAGRVKTLNDFMEYYTSALREQYPDIVISADVFGMVTSLNNDLTIGQTLEPFLEHFDYVSPMVYPSHYPEGFVNLPGHPDNHPYEVVRKAMYDGVVRARAAGYDIDKLRPWLQDFTCSWCAGYFAYGAEEVRAQIEATYDVGLDSWILWDAANRYTRAALEQETEQ